MKSECLGPSFPPSVLEYHSHTLSLGAILVLSLFSCKTLAAAEFHWAFLSGVTTTLQLLECSTLQVGLIPGSSYQPIPPLYLIGYPENGTPVVSTLQGGGSYNWEVPFPAGTTLLMQLIDSAGVTGGVSIGVYSVTEGPSAACHSNTGSSQVKLVGNTKQLATCESLVLDVSGGTAPYTLTIVAQNYLPFNSTFSQAGRLQWVNKLDPNLSPLIIAAVSDAHGNYAVSSGFINLSQGGNLPCSDTAPSFTSLPSPTPIRSPSVVLPPIAASTSSSLAPSLTQIFSSSASISKPQTQEETGTSAPLGASGSTTSATKYTPTQVAQSISKGTANVSSKLRIIIPASVVACLLLIGITMLLVRRRRASLNGKTTMLPRPFIRALSAFNRPRESFIQRVPSEIQAAMPQTPKRETIRLPSQHSRVNSSGLDDLVIVLRRYFRAVQTPEYPEGTALRKTGRGYNRIPEPVSPGIATPSRAIIEAVPTCERCDSRTLRRLVTVPPPMAVNGGSRTLSPRVSESLPDYDTSCAR